MNNNNKNNSNHNNKRRKREVISGCYARKQDLRTWKMYFFSLRKYNNTQLSSTPVCFVLKIEFFKLPKKKVNLRIRSLQLYLHCFSSLHNVAFFVWENKNYVVSFVIIKRTCLISLVLKQVKFSQIFLLLTYSCVIIVGLLCFRLLLFTMEYVWF